MAKAASGRTGRQSSAQTTGDAGDTPAAKPVRAAKRKLELKAIPDVILEDEAPKGAASDEPEATLEIVALDEATDTLIELPPDLADSDEALLAVADTEDLAADEDAEADLVPAPEEEEEEEEEDLRPVSNRVAPRMPGHMPGVPNRPIMHARMPAKAEIFHEGDHVVYPTHGVGMVERIATEEIAGHKLELIHITFEENRMTLRVPVSKARSAGLRKLASPKLFGEAIAVLKGRARIKRTMWSRRAQEYEAKINSGDPIAIAEVVRDLHRNAGQPDQSFSERQIYEAAMDRLAAELAALDKTDKPTAVLKLGEMMKAA